VLFPTHFNVKNRDYDSGIIKNIFPKIRKLHDKLHNFFDNFILCVSLFSILNSNQCSKFGDINCEVMLSLDFFQNKRKTLLFEVNT
jgi:hypothetical protein